MRKHRDIKLVTMKSEGIIYHQNQTIMQQNSFPKYPLEIEIRKTQTRMNKPVYLGLSILEFSKTPFVSFRMTM